MILQLPLLALTLAGASLGAAQATHAITGVSVSPEATAVPLRRNVKDLQDEAGPQWDLYIQAFAAMQKEDPTEDFSYFQVMGIHGKPYIEWNGGGPDRNTAWGGYCPHGESLFLPWHRPFVMLFEQILVGHARRLARQYPGEARSRYMQAAEQLRSPYWDWATDSDVPALTVPDTIQVNIADGNSVRQTEIDNPFATYRFPSSALNGEFGEFDERNRTQIIRCAAPDSYPATANERTGARPYKEWVYESFTGAESFSQFASTGDSGISLEQIHNGIHWDATCSGQFLSSDFSGFDPLFMLHHTNVDRLWAYWQAINPNDTIFTDSYEGGPRFSTQAGTTITPESPLNPFFGGDGELHTSLSINSIDGLGYSYEGLEYWERSAEQMAQDATRLINRLYAPSQQQQQQSRLARRGGSTLDLPISTKYSASIELDVEGLDRPCDIELYLGDKKVGDFVVMEQPRKGKIYGKIPFSNPLELFATGKLDPAQIIEAIHETFKMSIVKPDGRRLPISSVPGLKVEIEDVEVTAPPADDRLPKFGQPRRRPIKALEKAIEKAVDSLEDAVSSILSAEPTGV